MADSSLNPHDAFFGTKGTPIEAELLKAEYVCPICKATIITLAGNTLQYLESHVKLEASADGQTSFILYHKPDGGEFVPARKVEPPFLVVKSSIITSS